MSTFKLITVFLCTFGFMLSIMLAWKELHGDGKQSMKYAIIQLLCASLQLTYLVSALIR